MLHFLELDYLIQSLNIIDSLSSHHELALGCMHGFPIPASTPPDSDADYAYEFAVT